MAKVFIYKEYDLIDEIKKLLQKGYNECDYKKSYWILRTGLMELREAIEKSAEVMVNE